MVESLRTDQIADLAIYIRDKKVLNLSDPGTGKTPSVVVMQYYLWKHHQVGTAFVMPKSLLRKNRREILRFTEFREEDVVIVDGTKDQVVRQLNSGAKVFLMGFRRFALSWRSLPSYVRAVHVDEFHMGFKSADSQQTQALFSAFKFHMEWFIAMTGSIVNGKLSSVYPAIHIVEPRYYDSQESFLYQHALYDYDNNIIGWTNHEKISKIFGRHGLRHTFESLFGTNDPIFIPEMVKMTDQQREMYDKFQESAVLELERFILDGTLPGVGYMRARQLMEHPNEFPDLTRPGQFIDIMPDDIPGKEQLLEIHLEHHVTQGSPVIVFSSMVPQQRRISEMMTRYGISHGLINGDTPPKERDAIDVGFQTGKLKGIVCSPPCAAVGYNWQFCGDQEVEDIIFMTLSYLDTEFSQAFKRAIRQKRNKGLRVYIPQYEDSIDQNVIGILYKKSVDAHLIDPTYKVLQLSGFEKDYSMKTY